MTVQVRVTPRAAADLNRILDYLRTQSPQTAERFAQRFSHLLDGLSYFDTSRASLDREVRLLNMHPFPYLVFLRWRREQVEVIAIRHGARNPKSMPAKPR